MKKETAYIIKYTFEPRLERIEGVIEKKSDFKRWLKEHNKQRDLDGNEPEKDFEFSVESTTFYKFN